LNSRADARHPELADAPAPAGPEGPAAPVNSVPPRPAWRGLPKVARLLRARSYKRVLRHGRCFRTAPVRIHYLETRYDTPRLGLVVSRKVGNAVARNRVKRWLREVFRDVRRRLASPVDLVVIANPEHRPAGRQDYADAFDLFVQHYGRTRVNPRPKSARPTARRGAPRQGGRRGAKA
jgi:ribonuclease P protein component